VAIIRTYGTALEGFADREHNRRLMHIQPYWETYTVDTENTVVQGDANEIDIWYSRNGNKTFPRDLSVIYRVIKSMRILLCIFKEFRLCDRSVGPCFARDRTHRYEYAPNPGYEFLQYYANLYDCRLACVKDRLNEVSKGASNHPALAGKRRPICPPCEARGSLGNRIDTNLTDDNPQV
jgi:hypothetical protein